MRLLVVIALVIFSVNTFGRNLSEKKEWEAKDLPYDSRSGVRVEVYDLQKKGNDNIDINIRLHNISEKALDEVTVKVWVWKPEGVYVEEITLLSREDASFNRIRGGEEKFFPRRGSYYRLKGVKYSEMKDMKIKIGRLVLRGVR